MAIYRVRVPALPHNRAPLLSLLSAYLEDACAGSAASIEGRTLKWDYVGDRAGEAWNVRLYRIMLSLMREADFAVLIEEQDEGWDELLLVRVRDEEGREAEAIVTVSLDNTYPSIVGTVSDAETGEPLAGAVVEALGPEGFRRVAYTDSAGNYVLRNLEPARYTLRASALGY